MTKPLWILLLFAFTWSHTVFSDVISLRADIWCPMNCKPGSKREGYMIEIAKEIFAKAGHTIDYQELNWARALTEARSGKIGGVVGATLEKEGLVLTEESLGISSNCFFVRKDDNWVYDGVPSLKNKNLAVSLEYLYGEPVDSYINSNKSNKKLISVMGGDDIVEKNMKKLLAKRVDIVLEDKNVALDFINRTGSSVKEAGCTPGTDHIYIGFSEKNPKSKEYADLLNNGIKDLRKSGRLAEILKSYGLSDWATNTK